MSMITQTALRAASAVGTADRFATEVLAGLSAKPKQLPAKYFYDLAGSALFERITQLPEYYLTRAERALLAAHGGEIMADLTPLELVELGAGSVAKVRRLLGAAPVGASVLRYVPFDIAAGT